MNDLEQRVREAFDKVELPSETRARTLAAIDALDAQEKGAAAPAVRETVDSDARETAEPAVRNGAATAARRVPRLVVWRRAVVALAACLVLAVVGLTGSRLYFEETAFVDIDVNPSIELGINRFDIVVSARAYNGDGEALLEAVSITGKRYDDAVAEITSSAAFEPYMSSDAFVAISVVADDARQSDALRAQSDARLRDLPCEGTCHAVDEETHAAASASGMGTARYQAALQLMALDDTLTLEDCARMSMRELRDRIAALGGDAAGGSEGQGEGYGERAHDVAGGGSGHGQGAQGQGRGEGGKGHHAG